MTSCVDHLIRRSVLAALAALALAALAGADQARAQAPPAAVDQYKPSPLGKPDSDPDPPGRGHDGGPGGPGGPGGAAGAPGLGGLATPAGESPSADPGESEGGGEGGGNGSAGRGSAAEAGTGEGKSADTGGPVVAGYPLTSALVAAIIAIAIALCAAFGVAAWRRNRDNAALAGSS